MLNTERVSVSYYYCAVCIVSILQHFEIVTVIKACCKLLVKYNLEWNEM